MMRNDIKDQFENAEPVERAPPLPLRRDTAPPQPYPIKSLGKLLGGAAEAIMDIVRCPDAIAAQSVLAATSLAVQALANVMHPATGKARPLSLFMVTVAASGERKTATDDFALEPIQAREFALGEIFQSDQRAYRDAKALYDREREAILKSSKFDQTERAKRLAALGKEPHAPLLPILTVPDPTLEGLHKLYAVGEPSLGLFNDEGGTFIGGYGMSDEARLRTGSGLSDLWDGKPIKRSRGGDGTTHLRGRRLSLHIMVQPGVAEGLLADAMLQQQGLPSRLLVAAPVSIAGSRRHRQPKPASAAALKRYKDRLLKSLRTPQPRKATDDPELTPRPIRLSPNANSLWVAFADECEGYLGAGQRLEPVRAFANKLPEHALRIAAVLELVEKPEATDISADSFSRATTLARFYAGEALRLFEQGAASIELQQAEKLLHWLHGVWKKPRIGLTHVYQSGPNSIRAAALARQAMAILEQHHWVVGIEGGAKINDKQHREAWEIISPK